MCFSNMQWQKQLITLLTASNCLHVPQVRCPDIFSFSRICSACNQMCTLSWLCDAATRSRFKHRSHLCTWDLQAHTLSDTQFIMCFDYCNNNLLVCTANLLVCNNIAMIFHSKHACRVTLTLRLQQTGCVVNKLNNGGCLICWLKNGTHIKHILLGYKDQNSNEHPK